MTPVDPKDRIFCAIDTTDLDQAVGWSTALNGRVGGIKIGKEFFTAHGSQGVCRLTASGLPLFLDLKFHDIPNTVAGAIRAALPLRPRMINVHAAGGSAMMRAAAEAAAGAGPSRPLVLAVTVLTSLDDADLVAIGINDPAEAQVLRLAQLAQAAGLDGVVCSAKEIKPLRQALGPDFKLVVPGIRPAGADAGDQKRVMTPPDAVAAGADYLVIGRPITAAADPVDAARAIAASIAAG
jgi:orotidine-5'-phosphate decarboxylase